MPGVALFYFILQFNSKKMSIVATMIFPNGGAVMYGDKRAVTNFGSREITTDTYLKVHRICPGIICGITGHGEWGLALISKLKQSADSDASEMIGTIKAFHEKFNPSVPSTVTLAGIYIDNRPFLWTYRTASGDTTFEQNASYAWRFC